MTGAIFDMDGTLLDSMRMWETIGSDYLRSLGITPPEDLDRNLLPMSLLQASQYMIDNFGLKDTADELAQRTISMLEDRYRYEVPLKPFVLPFLTRLSDMGVKMCVATATERYLAEAALERLDVLHFFKFVLCCTEAGSGKDNPEIYNAALRRLGTGKNETVVFEDALHAVKTAKKAGFRVVGVYDASSDAVCEEVKSASDIYIYSFEEIMELKM